MSCLFQAWGRAHTLATVLVVASAGILSHAAAQEEAPSPAKLTFAPCGPTDAPVPPLLPGYQRGWPINLPTALQLGHARNLDIALASQQLRVAAAQLTQARVLWLPTIYLGTDYFRHDGQLQDFTSTIVSENSHSSFMAGVGPYMLFSFSDALFAPLAARQVVRAREAGVQIAANDTLLAVAEAYFNVQQARGQLAGALDAVRRGEDLLRRVEKLAPGVVPALEIKRARADLARQRQVVSLAQNNWRAASAELIRVLDLDPTLLVQPLEPPQLQVSLIGIDKSLEELIAVAVANRPELAGQRALVQASLEQLRQERWRPLLPILAVRGDSTPVSGTLAAGVFGGGQGSSMANFNIRQDWDVQLLWKLDNFGLGNRAIIRQRGAENQAARIELLRVRDRVARDVAQSLALAQTAADRVRDAETELRNAEDSVEENLVGVSNPRLVGKVFVLLIRPQEVVAAIGALNQAYADYYAAVADFNRAQFRLYWALGRPAHLVLNNPENGCGANPPAPLPPAHQAEAPARNTP